MKMIDQFSIQKRMNHLQQAIHPKKILSMAYVSVFNEFVSDAKIA